jgi:hypothetical protein
MDSGQGAPKTYSGLIPPLGIKSLLQLQFKVCINHGADAILHCCDAAIL